jgi:hypothetical protein
VLRARGGPGDEELAAELLGAAGTTARALGMPLAAEPPPAEGGAGGTGATAGAGRPAPPAPAAVAVFRREGEYWTIAWRGPVFRVRHATGLAHLARLLGQPGRELHALDLAAGESGHVSGGQAVPVLDGAAKAAYRRRLGELAAELEEAERWADPERAARARAEMDALTDQLAGAMGLGGRDRGLPSDAERARVSVTKAIRAAIRRIAEHDAALGEHLTRTVRTGTFCVYAADPATPSRWER